MILEPLVAASPEDFSAGMSLVAGYIELKRTEEAMTLIERMASLRPENHLPMVQRATGLLQRADACREAGDGVGAQRALRDALASADSAVAAEPEFPTGHLRRAAALAGLRRDDEALGAYRRAVALGETSERVYQQMMGPAERSKGLSEVERLLKEGISKGSIGSCCVSSSAASTCAPAVAARPAPSSARWRGAPRTTPSPGAPIRSSGRRGCDARPSDRPRGVPPLRELRR